MSHPVAQDLLGRLAALGVRPTGLSADSRQVAAGDVFLAYPGLRSDGRSFIADAAARGASAVLWEARGGAWPASLGLPNLPVEDLREQVGFLADRVYGEPSARLWLAGVTGTNGKTTVSQWIARALETCGSRCAVIGTLGSGFPGRLASALHTTPDAVDVHRLMAEFLRQGADAATAEVSSIGLDQGRVNGTRFNVAILTNLTRDHLDYHGSMEKYAAAKARFFDMPGLDAAVVNVEDSFGLAQARRLFDRGLRVIAYARSAACAQALPGAEFLLADGLRQTASGQRFELCWNGLRVPMNPRSVGEFNVSNMLAVIGALIVKGVDPAEAAHAVGQLTAPEGRMQLLGGIGEPLAIVDYAHTPDALAQVLTAARATAKARRGALVCVFGCGGDRDAGKRPLMGEIAARLADRVILTSDNPRGEEPLRIIAEIAAGAPAAEQLADRAQAIACALRDAAADDVVVLAGKGHEDYQEVAGVRRPFSDLEQARLALAARRTAGGTS